MERFLNTFLLFMAFVFTSSIMSISIKLNLPIREDYNLLYLIFPFWIIYIYEGGKK